MVNTLLVLAGGEGTRLKEITGNTSKPLVKISGQPIITGIINKLLKELFIEKVYLLIQRKHLNQYVDYIKDQKEYINAEIELFIEEEKLGTGGAIKNFLKKNNIFWFYATNADTIIKSNISEFKHSKLNSILCTEIVNDSRFGSVQVDNQNKIKKFDNVKKQGISLINVGLYKLEGSIFFDIKEEVFDLENRVFPLLAERGRLNCFKISSDFQDIGIPEAYWNEVKSLSLDPK